MPITTNENKNRVSDLLRVDGTNPKGVRQGIAASPFSRRNTELADVVQGRKSIVASFQTGTLPAGVTYTSEGTAVTAVAYSTGQAVLTSDDVSDKSESLVTALLWKANRQLTGEPLVFECRWAPGATITTAEYWFGFSDAGTEAVDTAIYALSATSTFTTSVPSDAAVIGFSTTPTSLGAYTSGGNQHTALATKANTDTVVATGGGAVAASTFYNYRIELDADGTARYYVNGNLLGTQATALTATVALSAVAYVIPRATGAGKERAATIDYIYVSGDGPTVGP